MGKDTLTTRFTLRLTEREVENLKELTVYLEQSNQTDTIRYMINSYKKMNDDLKTNKAKLSDTLTELSDLKEDVKQYFNAESRIKSKLNLNKN